MAQKVLLSELTIAHAMWGGLEQRMIFCDVDPVAGAVEDVVPVVPIGLFRGVGDLRIDVAE